MQLPDARLLISSGGSGRTMESALVPSPISYLFLTRKSCKREAEEEDTHCGLPKR